MTIPLYSAINMYLESLPPILSVLNEYPFGLSQWRSLLIIQSKGKLRMSELAEFSDFTTAAATGCIDRLEAMKMVQREHATDDRRNVWVSLSEDGAQVLERLRSELNELEIK